MVSVKRGAPIEVMEVNNPIELKIQKLTWIPNEECGEDNILWDNNVSTARERDSILHKFGT